MSWVPNPTVTLDGADFTGRTVSAVSVRRGRQRVYEATNAGYASVELLWTDGQVPTVEVGQELQVFVDDSAGSAQPLFTGQVSDWSSQVRWFGGEPVVSVQVQAVGPLGRLNRRTIMVGGAPSEDDGARVLQALEDGFGSAWEEVSTSLTWDAVGTAVSWETFDGFDPSAVDPGVFTLAALGSADGGYSALQVAQDAAQSGQGVLFELPDGGVGYGDADRRPANAAAGYLEVPVSVVDSSGLSLMSQLADVTNRVTVEYDGGAVEVDDSFSITTYGVLATTLSTELVNLSNAQALADSYLERHSSPQVMLEQVRVNLANCGTALRDALIAVNTNDAVELTGFPSGVGFSEWQGFVEGVEWTVDPFRTEVGLNVSAAVLSFGAQRWGQVGGTIAWNAVGTALTWAAASEVTV